MKVTNSFKGYVLVQELAKKSNTTSPTFRQLKNIKMDKMGHFSIVLKDSLPKKYQVFADECLDLEKYLTVTYLNDLLGCGLDYLSTYMFYKKQEFKHKKIGHAKLVELSKEFVTLWDRGKVPFLINNSNKQYAEKIIKMNHLTIGFY